MQIQKDATIETNKDNKGMQGRGWLLPPFNLICHTLCPVLSFAPLFTFNSVGLAFV